MGAMGRAHGIRGEIGVDWKGETGLSPGDAIYLQAGNAAPAPWQVEKVRIHNGRMLLSLQGINDRTAAERLTGAKIYLPRAAVPPPAEDEAFVADLLGCEVFLVDGEPVGRLGHVEFPGGKMIWAIETPEDREILFPAEPQFIEKLDMENRRIVIDPPAGLLDIYSA